MNYADEIDQVALERDREHVHFLRLRLRRPEKRNALSPEMVRAIPRALERAAELPPEECRAVVVCGDGPMFCAGADLVAMGEAGRAEEERNRGDARALAALFRTVAEFPAPVIAAVHGVAFGAGLGLAVASDVVVAEENAEFWAPEVRLGIVPAVISPYVVRRVGSGWATQLLVRGVKVSGEDAARAGVAHRLAPVGGLDRSLNSVCLEFFMGGPEALRRAKRLVLRAAPLPTPEHVEETVEAIGAARSSEEGQAGVNAFFAKKQPWWAPTRN